MGAALVPELASWIFTSNSFLDWNRPIYFSSGIVATINSVFQSDEANEDPFC